MSSLREVILPPILFGSYPLEDLELVLISMTSSSSSKTDFIYIPLCVFDIGVFTGSLIREGHTSLPLVNSPLRVLNIFTFCR